jgi:YesN/AraC family two-component response regulator
MAICEVENGEFVEEVRLHLEEALEPYRSELLGVVSEQSQTRGLLLLNTRADIGRVFTILRSIKNAMNDHDIELTISVAGCSDSFEQLHRIYTQALRQLEDRFFIGKNEVICCTEPAAEGVAESYENDTGEEIVNAVKARNAAKAESALDRWSKEHVREGMHSMEYVKCQYFQLISHVRDSLVQLGVEEDWYKRTRYQMFERIQSTETIDELQSYISGAIQESVDAVQTLKEKHHGRFVERTIDYIQENYCHDISLDDISGAVYLSPKYLSAIFKQETGRTVFSYVTDLRMQKAAALLEEESIQVKDLAGQVGYNNVQSFIRFFKRTFGLTPAQYRKTRKVYSRSGDE